MAVRQFSSNGLWISIQFWSNSKPFNRVHTGQDFLEVTRYALYSHMPTISLNIYELHGNGAVFSQSMKYDPFNLFDHDRTGN